MTEIKQFHKGLEASIKRVWWESNIVNFDKLKHPMVTALVTFCPLYQPGFLGRSRIMYPPVSIEQSRVGNKWQAVTATLSAMKDYLVGVGGDLKLMAVFAGKGVLLTDEPTEKEKEALLTHTDAYKQATDSFCTQQQIDYIFTTYDDLEVAFPQFVNPNSKIPGDYPEANLIDTINQYLQDETVNSQVTNNRKNRVLLEKIHQMEGIRSTENVFWLVTGYLAFDYMIPSLAGQNGVYLATERFEPLFGISNMTPSLKEMPRVHIKS